MIIANHRVVDVLTSITERLVMTGMYASPEEAVEALALTQIDREIEKYQERIAALEAKYKMSFEGAHILVGGGPKKEHVQRRPSRSGATYRGQAGCPKSRSLDFDTLRYSIGARSPNFVMRPL